MEAGSRWPATALPGGGVRGRGAGCGAGVPFATAYSLCADNVAVRHRLPRLWERLQAGVLPAWRARLRGDPDHERAVEETALAGRGVWFDHQTSTASGATTSMSAVLDAWDALDLDAAWSGVAADLRSLGDTREWDLRRAEALALLAHPQRVLGVGPDGAGPGQRHEPVRPREPRGPRRVRSRGSGWAGPTGSWSARCWTPPTLNSPATRPVDQHDPPPAMRDLVADRRGRPAPTTWPACVAGTIG